MAVYIYTKAFTEPAKREAVLSLIQMSHPARLADKDRFSPQSQVCPPAKWGGLPPPCTLRPDESVPAQRKRREDVVTTDGCMRRETRTSHVPNRKSKYVTERRALT
jgi:hypothetical protein